MQANDSSDTWAHRVSFARECPCSRTSQCSPATTGEGIVGETDDKIITFFSLGLVVFFTLVVILGSAIQGALERRKNQRKAAELRRRVGW